MNWKVREGLDGILGRFRAGDIPEAIALASYPMSDIPSRSWSLTNRTLMFLSTKAECVFFHELAHASHEKIKGNLKSGQDPFQEIVAELAATALCRLVGKDPSDILGNSYRYIESYAQKAKVPAISACLTVMTETEKVIKLILKGGEPCVAELTTAQR